MLCREKLDLCNLERIKDAVGQSVRPLACQVTADAFAELRPGLTDIDRFTVVVIEDIHTNALSESLSARLIGSPVGT